MMSDGRLAQDLSASDYDPERYVSHQSEEGEMPLLELKQKVQILSDTTAKELKKNVYKNYSQFIETAREISILEGEMYQVSHMLTEQKSLMNTMLEMSLVSDKAVVEEPTKDPEPENPEEETRRNLAFLLEKVEGCSSVTEVPGRQLIHNGDLADLDMESFAQIQRVHMFLLNDSLMIASWLPNRRGPVRYRFQGLYELDNLAIVNIRDAGAVKNAFKVLMFPDSKIYAADSAKSKRQWLDILEETKKKKLARDKQKREAALRLAEQQAASPSTPKQEESSTSIEDTDEVDAAMDTAMLSADWLQELPEDLDMCIAQRDFEGAVDLVERVNEHLKDCQKTPAVKEFKARIDHRAKLLTEGLMSELQVSPERSLRGGPRAARRAVAQLIRLGKSAQACDLFLKNRTAIIKYNIRQLKFEGATSLYVRCLCNVFFASLSETGREFHKAFPQLFGCFSAFIVWAKTEMELFIRIFKRHTFDSKSSLATISECVSIATKHCVELSGSGLDLGFYLDNQISEDLEKAVLENRAQIIEAVKFRAKDDKWNPLNLGTETECMYYVDDMAAVGLDLKEHVYNLCFISLTMNTTQYCKVVMVLAQSLILVHTSEREALITETLVDIFRAQVKHLEASVKNEKFKENVKFILKNCQFILEALMSKIDYMYRNQGIPFPAQLAKVNEEYKRLKTIVGTMT
ncbi:exocyst complex component 8-like [Mya arenaria]|uniref:exocyst complex component 8-like n=1 Tax=Mya arenaria TaxID=6604 RepID=UPI0022DF35A6|nr:exocyst complex component 8-like [Mya arenaria]